MCPGLDLRQNNDTSGVDKMRRRAVLLCSFAGIGAGCAGPKVTSAPGAVPSGHVVRTVAIQPVVTAVDGILGDALGVQLSKRGMVVMDAAATAQAFRESQVDITTQQVQGMAVLRRLGVDALIAVAAVPGYDGAVQTASLRVLSAHTGKVLTNVIWENAWSGMRGSIADRAMRSGLVEAAEQLADALVSQLN
jgi:hypothetical protein